MARQRDEGSDSPAPFTNPKNLLRPLDKGFRVLESFGAAEPGLALVEAARRTKLDNATAFRLLNTLVALGYVDRVACTRRFRLTLKCLDIGFNAGDPHVGGGVRQAYGGTGARCRADYRQGHPGRGRDRGPHNGLILRSVP